MGRNRRPEKQGAIATYRKSPAPQDLNAEKAEREAAVGAVEGEADRAHDRAGTLEAQNSSQTASIQTLRDRCAALENALASKAGVNHNHDGRYAPDDQRYDGRYAFNMP